MPKTLTNERKRELLEKLDDAKAKWSKAVRLVTIKIAEGTAMNDDEYAEVEHAADDARSTISGIAESDLSPDDEHFAVEGSDTPEEEAEGEAGSVD